MSWRDVIKRANLMMLNGDLTAAESLLHTAQSDETAGQRAIAHYKALIAFNRGEVLAAKAQMEAALSRFGENINLIRDLVAVQYHLHDMLGFRTNLDRLERLLVEHEEDLAYQTKFECEAQIGKYLEEDARLAPALHFYDRALQRAEKPEHRLYALMQKARWHSLYRAHPDLSQFYRELISVPKANYSTDLYTELQHTLMIVEMQLVGIDHAWHRLESVLNQEQIFLNDQKLMAFDLLEEVLVRELEVPRRLTELVTTYTEPSPFEAVLLRLMQLNSDSGSLLQDLHGLASQLPWASYIRVLGLCANREQNPVVRGELLRKIQLIVVGLDTQSRELWADRLHLPLKQHDLCIFYSARSRSLLIQEKRVDLSKKKIALQLIESLIHKPLLDVDQAIKILWNSDFSPDHYHRLRMSVHRLNSLLHDEIGLGKVFEVDSQNVRIRPGVQLKTAEKNYDNGLGRLL